MTTPFTPWRTYAPSATPKIKASDLNEWQASIGANSWVTALSRPCFSLYCQDQANIYGTIAPLHILDAVTGKWTYVAFPYLTINTTNVSGGSFTNSAWHVVYARCSSGVQSIVVEAATNPAIMTPDGVSSLPFLNAKSGDFTYRYITAFYVDGAGYIQRFAARDGVVTWLDDVYIVGSAGGGQAGATSWQSAATHAIGAAPWWCSELDVHGLVYNTSAGADCDLAISYSGDSSTIPRVITASRDASGGPETCGGELTIAPPQYSIQWMTATTSCVVKVKARKWRD